MPLSAIQISSIVISALEEDLLQGDVTTDNLPALNKKVSVAMNARQDMILSGAEVAEMVFKTVDATLSIEAPVANGIKCKKNDLIMTITGNFASILKAERTALNFVQHCSGIATETNKYVSVIEGTNSKVTNTRKTTPGLRLIERQAVIDGGGSPHRYNLGSAVMLKDNHLAGVSITDAIRELRSKIAHTQTIEVEADNLDQVEEAAKAGADIIMLDNMSPATIEQALTLINCRSKTEASGNINLDTIKTYADTGVDYISTSKITLGAPAVDIGLDFI